MKKLLSIIIMSALSISIFTACTNSGTQEDTQGEDSINNEQVEQTELFDGNFATGLGIITYTNSSADASDNSDGRVQVDSYPVTLTVDQYGKITNVSIDRIQTKVNFNQQGIITTDLDDEIFTKMELGPEIGMINASAIGVEWDDQTSFLMDWLIGKTLDEIKSLTVIENGKTTLDDVDLVSHVTIDLLDNLTSIELAMRNLNAFDTNDENVRTGMGISTVISNATNADVDFDGNAQVQSVIYGVTVDLNDVILAVSIDSHQTEGTFNSEGQLVASTSLPLPSDWNQQIEALSNWLIGKTTNEALAMQTSEAEGMITTAEPELMPNVNINLKSHLIALEKAINNLR